ncbi:MAG: hypothetical protein WAM14_26795, partial [Candidatus Nitrosopolaris sp.]
IEEQFRMEAIKRFGARKGNLSKALEEAMDLWIEKDVLENLKEKTMRPDTLPSVRKNIVDAMKSHGIPATVALSEMLKNPRLLPSDIQYIASAINELRTAKD